MVSPYKTFGYTIYDCSFGVFALEWGKINDPRPRGPGKPMGRYLKCADKGRGILTFIFCSQWPSIPPPAGLGPL